MGIPEIEAFLTHLAVDKKAAASLKNPCAERSRSEALPALLFLYREVLTAAKSTHSTTTLSRSSCGWG